MERLRSKYAAVLSGSRRPAEDKVSLAVPETHQTAPSTLSSVRDGVEQDISGRPQSHNTSRTLRIKQQMAEDAVPGDSGIQATLSKETSSQSSNEDLWDIAYENLRKTQGKLVYEFEKSLAKESAPKGTTTSNFHGLQGLKREIQMAKLIRERLKVIDDSKWTLKIGSKTVVVQEQMDRLVKVVTFAKDFVSSIVASTPHGAIAWAGVCILLPLLVNPTEETQSNIDGLEYIATLIFCYTVQERIYLQQVSPTGLSADVLELRSAYRVALLNIYTLILEYEARSVVHLTRSRLQRATLDTFKANDWKSLLSNIRNSDLTCGRLSHALESERLFRGFEVQYRQIQDKLSQIHARYEKEDSKCHEIFRTTDYQWLKNQNPVKVVGTCEWFLNHSKYQDWIEQPKSSVLWVSADPGCGKSVLSRHLVDLYSGHADMKLRSVCYFFFKDNSELTRSANHALCAILHELFAQKKILIRNAQPYCDQNGSQLTEIFDDLWQILLASAADPDSGEITCVLDALDECAEETRLPLIKKLSEFFSDPPQGTRLDFIVTSRPYSSIGDAFFTNGLDTNSIKLMGENPAEMEQIRDEIRLVTEEQVRQFEKLRRYKGIVDDTHVRLQRRLDEIDNRTYLWVALIFPELQKNAGSARGRVLRIIDTLPRTVSEAYEKILSQSPDHVQAKKLLHLVVVAFRPLTIFEVGIILAVEDGDVDLAEEDQIPKQTLYTMVRELCGLFVNIRDDKIYLVHQTAKEFLLQDQDISRERHPSIWEHSFHPSQSHCAMALTCITYLGFNIFETQPLVNTEKHLISNLVNTYTNDHPFLAYASCYWAMHYNLSERKRNPLALSANICNTRSKRFQTWFHVSSALTEIQCPFHNLDDLSLRCWLAHYDAMEELLKVPGKVSTDDKAMSLLIAGSKSDRKSLELLLQHGIPINGSDQGAVIAYAVFNNDTEIMEFLLEQGASPNATWNDEPLLHYTIAQEHLEAARLLLLHGADRNTQNRQGQTVFHVAITQRVFQRAIFLLDGLQDTSKSTQTPVLLIPTRNQTGLAEANTLMCLQRKDRYGRTALDLAVWLGQTEEAKILLQYTDDINVTDILGQTPLHGACIRDTELVKVLLKNGADPDIQDKEGRTALHLAVRNGSNTAAKLLLEYGANVNIKDRHGDAALILADLRQYHVDLLQKAIRSSNFELARKLLSGGADINLQDDYGHSTVHIAAIGGNLEAFDLFLDYNPNLYLLSKDGKTALELTSSSWMLTTDFPDLLREFENTAPAMVPRMIGLMRRRAAVSSTFFADLDDLLMAEHLELLCQWSIPLRVLYA